MTNLVGGGSLATPTLQMYPFFKYAIQVNIVQAVENIEVIKEIAKRVARFFSIKPVGWSQGQEASSISEGTVGGASVEKNIFYRGTVGGASVEKLNVLPV